MLPLTIEHCCSEQIILSLFKEAFDGLLHVIVCASPRLANKTGQLPFDFGLARAGRRGSHPDGRYLN